MPICAKTIVYLVVIALSVSASNSGFAENFDGFFASPNKSASVQLARDGQTVVGQFIDADGVVYALNGAIDNSFAQGLMSTADGQATFQLQLEGDVLKFNKIPLNASGLPSYDARVTFSFIRRQVNTDVATVGPDPFVSSLLFLDQFTRLSPAAFTTAYGQMAAGERILVQNFDHLHLHALRMFCAATPDLQADGLRELQAAQSIKCHNVEAGIGLLSAAEFLAYQSRLEKQAQALSRIFRCHHGVDSVEICRGSGLRLAEAASSWKDARAILGWSGAVEPAAESSKVPSTAANPPTRLDIEGLDERAASSERSDTASVEWSNETRAWMDEWSFRNFGWPSIEN
jgi:hypothetical protein